MAANSTRLEELRVVVQAKLAPYVKFAAMIARHWDGIASYSRPENKITFPTSFAMLKERELPRRFVERPLT